MSTPYIPSFTQENLTAIEQAIATGATDVYYGDKRVAYRSLDDMMRIRDLIRKELGMNKAGNRIRYPDFNKGL